MTALPTRWFTLSVAAFLAATLLCVTAAFAQDGSSLPSLDELFGEDVDDEVEEETVEEETVEEETSETPPPSRFVERPDEQFVLLEMRLPGIVLTDDMPGFYDHDEERLFLPLWVFLEAAEFPIEVDVVNGHALGWFFRESRTFELDLAAQRLVIAGTERRLEEGQVEHHFDDIYVDVDVLADWFNFDYDFVFSLLRLDLSPRELFPAQLRRERARRQARLREFSYDDGPRFELIVPPYQLASIPAHELRLDLGLPTTRHTQSHPRRRRTVPQSNSYQLRGAGDLLYMNGSWSITGSETRPISRVRFRLERRDPTGSLLGPAEATQVAVGDIHSPGVNLLARSSPGRGVEVSNYPLTRASAFDHTRVSGAVEPGWDVEVYRNDVLIDYQNDFDADHYHFDAIPLLFGMNEIRVVQYGPFGEEREEVHRFFIGPGMITPGEGYYRVSISQHNTEVIPLGSLRQDTDIDGRPRGFVEYEHGVLDSLALLGRLNTLPHRDGSQLFYATAGMRNSFERVYTTLEFTGGSGFAIHGAAQTRFLDVNLVVDSSFLFPNFRSERPPVVARDTRSRTRVRLNGVLTRGLPLRIPASLTLESNVLADGTLRARVANRLSTQILGVHISNAFQLQRYETNSYFLSGNLGVRRRTRTISPFGQLNYSIDQGIRSYVLGADWRIHSNLQARGDFVHDFFGSQNLTIRKGFTHRLPHFSWGANIGLDHRGGYSAGLSLTTAVGHNPQSEQWEFSSDSLVSSGTVVPRVFWDMNQDGVFDDGDEPIDGAQVAINNNRRRDRETNELGIAAIPNITPDHYVDVELASASLYDPYFVPSVEGYTVVTRPGTVTYLDFPVVMTGEVDGTVWMERQGMMRPLGSIELELLTFEGELVAETTTAFDGFYLFDFIKPGIYIVRISPEQLGRMQMEASQMKTVEIGVDGTVVAGQDFVLRRH